MNNLLKIGLMLTAIDRVTAPLRGVQSAIDRTSKAAKGADGAMADMARSMSRINAIGSRMRNIGGGMMLAGGGAAAGLGLTAVPGEAIRAEHALRALGNVGNLTNAQILNMQTSLVKTTRETNQDLSALIQGTGTLVAAGMDPRIATRFMGVIGKTATATQSSVDDIAQTAYAVYDNLKVPESQLMKTLDAMTSSGKQGRFELKNMAQFFPMLTAGAQSLGMKGVPAVASLGAALQIAMKGAGSPEEAANNFQNFLQKITSKETVKNFSKFGVNVESEMKLAAAKGIDPIEHMMGVIQRLTGGNKFKLAQIFGDMQVGNFLTPMMKNMAEYRSIRDKSMAASGVVDVDYQKMMGTTLEQWKQTKTTIAAIALSALVGPLSMLNRILKLVSSNATVAKVAMWGIGAVIVGGGMLTGLGTAMTILPKLRIGLTVLTTVVTKLGPALRIAGLAIRFIGFAFASFTPAALIIGIIAAAMAIYKYWGPISKFFSGVWASIDKALGGLPGRMLTAGKNIFLSLWNGMKATIGKPIELMKQLATKLRAYLPFSPAKEGPLRDIHRVRIMETIASAMKPAPMVRAMRAATAATMIAAVPAGAAGHGSAGGGHQISFSPVINISASTPKEAREQLDQGLDISFAKFERLMDRYTKQQARRTF